MPAKIAHRMSSALLALVAGGIFIIIILRKWKLFTGRFNKEDTKEIFRIGLPFIVERLAVFFLAYSDRFFIDYFEEDTAEVGIYSAGSQLAMIVNLSILTLNNTFYPHLYKNLSADNIDYRSLRKAILVFVGLALAATILVIVFTPLIFQLFVGEKYAGGKPIAVLLSVGFFFWAVYNVFLAFLLNMKVNRIIMMISVAGMIASIILNSITVRYFGAIGATYTAILVYALMATLVIYFVHRKYDLVKIFRNEKKING